MAHKGVKKSVKKVPMKGKEMYGKKESARKI